MSARCANKPEGQVVVGLLLFQDICIGPLMLLIALTNPRGDDQGIGLLLWVLWR